MYMCNALYLNDRIGGTVSQTTHVLPSFNPKVPEGTKHDTQ